MKDFIFLKINDKEFVLPPETIKEIIKTLKITGVPNADEDILGLTNYRGRPIPVFNTPKFFNEPYQQKMNSKLIITNIVGEDVAFVVDSIERIAEVNEAELAQTIDYSTFVDDSITNKINQSNNKHYLIKITINSQFEMVFLKVIICLDLMREIGEIVTAKPAVESIEEDNFKTNMIYLLFSTDKMDINKLFDDMSKVSEIESVEFMEIKNNKHYADELKSYFDKSKSSINLFDIKKIAEELKDRYKLTEE